MTVEEIKKELDSLNIRFQVAINENDTLNVTGWAYSEAKELKDKYHIKKSQSMFLVMIAINNYLNDN